MIKVLDGADMSRKVRLAHVWRERGKEWGAQSGEGVLQNIIVKQS